MSCFDIKRNKEEMGELKDEMLAMKELVKTEERSFNDEEFPKWDDLENKYNELKSKVDTAERMERVPAKSDIVVAQRSYKPKQEVITRSDAGRAACAWFTRNSNNFKSEYAEAADKVGFNHNNKLLDFKLRSDDDVVQVRSQSVGVLADGGYSVSGEIVGGFEQALESVWGWQEHCEIIRTDHYAPHRIVTLDDTTNDATYAAELTSYSNVDMVFSDALLGAWKITSGIFPISNEILDGNEIGLASKIGGILGARIARKLSKEVTNGTGSSALRGFTKAGDVTVGVTAASATVLAQNELYDLYFSVLDQHRESAVWMMHSLVLNQIVQLEDTTGRKLMGAGLNGSPQLSMLGKPIVVNDNLPSVLAIDAIPVYFGDFKSVKVRLVRDMSIRESSDQYFLEDAKCWITDLRADSQYVNAGSDPIKSLKMAAS